MYGRFANAPQEKLLGQPQIREIIKNKDFYAPNFVKIRVIRGQGQSIPTKKYLQKVSLSPIFFVTSPLEQSPLLHQ